MPRSRQRKCSLARINRDVGENRKPRARSLVGRSSDDREIYSCVYVRVLPAAAAIATMDTAGRICLSLVTIVQANHLFKWLKIVLFAVRKR